MRLTFFVPVPAVAERGNGSLIQYMYERRLWFAGFNEINLDLITLA